MGIKPILYLLFFSSFTLQSFSQSNELSGKVKDQGGNYLEFANVSLWKDSTFLVGDVTNEAGAFSIPINQGSYELRISFLGYEKWTNIVEIKADVNLADIVLTPESVTFDEVVVTHKIARIERLADRLVVNVDQSILANGRSAIDIISVSPGVWINGSGVISINGKSGTQVMVDGKLLKLSGMQLQSYLRTLRSEEISKVEVIETPGAEFDAEGKGGLINIILKRKRTEGLNGRYYLGYEQGKFPHISSGIFTNYKREKWTFFGNYYSIKEKAFSDLKEKRNSQNNDFVFQSSSYQINKTFNQQFRVGATYDINNNQNLGLEVVGTFNNKDEDSEVSSRLTSLSTALTKISGDYFSERDNKFINATLNYNNTLDTLGTHFKFLLDYTSNHFVENSNYNSTYVDENDVFVQNFIYRNDIPNNAEITTAKLDLVRPFLSGEKITAGIKFSQNNIDSKLTTENLINNEWIFDKQQSNVFDYKERISAAYIDFSKSIKNTHFKLGLRAEHSDVRGHSVTLDKSFHNDFLDWFPSIFINQTLSSKKGNSLSLYYGRRLERPNFESLNPFSYRINDFTLVTGNSDLTPQYTNTIQLSLLLRNNYSVAVYYSRTNEAFTQVLIPNGELSVYQQQNLDVNATYGVNGNVPINFNSWWSAYNYVSLYNNEYEFKSENYTSSRWTFSGRTNHTFSINSSLSLEVLASYISAENYGNLLLESVFYADIGLRKFLMKKKLQLSLKVLDVFKTRRNDIRVDFNNTLIDLDQRNQTQKLQIHLLYNFNLGTKFRRKNLESSNYDEKGRLKN